MTGGEWKELVADTSAIVLFGYGGRDSGRQARHAVVLFRMGTLGGQSIAERLVDMSDEFWSQRAEIESLSPSPLPTAQT